jgi:S1-C subfamily serine protease
MPDDMDRSGLHLLLVDGEIRVSIVDGGSPAFHKGIKAGDVIVNCAGRQLNKESLAFVRRLLCRPGKMVQLGIRHGAEEKYVTIALSK